MKIYAVLILAVGLGGCANIGNNSLDVNYDVEPALVSSPYANSECGLTSIDDPFLIQVSYRMLRRQKSGLFGTHEEWNLTESGQLVTAVKLDGEIAPISFQSGDKHNYINGDKFPPSNSGEDQSKTKLKTDFSLEMSFKKQGGYLLSQFSMFSRELIGLDTIKGPNNSTIQVPRILKINVLGTFSAPLLRNGASQYQVASVEDDQDDQMTLFIYQCLKQNVTILTEKDAEQKRLLKKERGR